MAEMLGERLLGWHVGAFGAVLIPFLIAAVIKTLQGSSLVAAITAAGMVQPLLVSLGLDGANGKALAALAIGAGAMTVSHVNDEYFWLVADRAGLTPLRRSQANRRHAAARPFRRRRARCYCRSSGLPLLKLAGMPMNSDDVELPAKTVAPRSHQACRRRRAGGEFRGGRRKRKPSRQARRASDTSLPPGFRWGTATSAYQIEGAWQEDGKGEFDLGPLHPHPRHDPNNDTGDVALDHYHRYKDDVQLMKALGARHLPVLDLLAAHFSARHRPPNAKGLDFYDRLVDELLANGIEPFATLYHWDLPQALQDNGGGGNPATRQRPLPIMPAMSARKLSDRVKHFFTINELTTFVELGYGTGVFAPGLKLPPARLNQVRHHRRAWPRPCGASDPRQRQSREPKSGWRKTSPPPCR